MSRFRPETTRPPRVTAASSGQLSRREAEILTCLMEGRQNKGIARDLGLTETAVKLHIKAILGKVSRNGRLN